jgi:hypothetical protein
MRPFSFENDIWGVEAEDLAEQQVVLWLPGVLFAVEGLEEP